MSQVQQQINEKHQKMGQLNNEARQVFKAADDANRELTSEEQQKVDQIYEQYDNLASEVGELENQRRRRAKLEEMDNYLNSTPGRQTSPNATGTEPKGGGRRGKEVQPTEKLGVTEDGRMVYDLGGPENDHRMLDMPLDGPEADRDAKQYLDAFNNYLVGGNQAMQPNAALQVGQDPKGGYLAPMRTSAMLIRFVNDEVFMRQLARVLPPLRSGVSLGIPSHDSDPNDADWTAEIPSSNISADTAMKFGQRELQPHLLTKLVKISMKLLRAAVIDPERLVRERIGYKMAVSQEKAFLTGDGAQQPLGIFTASSDGISTSRDVTSGTTDDYDGDDIIDTFFNLKAQYQRRATWVAHRDHMAKIRKLKDGQGQYIWRGIGDSGLASQDLVAGQAGMILERPYVMSEFAPNTISGGNYALTVGDFSRGYWIVDSLQTEIQRLSELFAQTNEIGLLGRSETDGMPVLEEAFARLKIKS
jgi:HK97 family phage major capsid protein